MRINYLIDKLASERSLSLEEYKELVELHSDEARELVRERAVEVRKRLWGNRVFVRGLIEIGNICKNDCLYCGIRRSNRTVVRYHLTKDEILAACREGYSLGFRTFVLQGGECALDTDEAIADIIKEIKLLYPSVAVTLSLGERSRESYERLKLAGADRYLLRHETADSEHYSRLHPASLTLENRIRCLYDLKQLGYQVGCGFMVGSPYQTADTLAKDLKFIETFSPEMCGIGPFIPSKDTPFAAEARGSLELTLYLISIIRLIRPTVLLPATTALGTVHPHGRELGIMHGANVVMPNLTPPSMRKNYSLYDNKLSEGAESAQQKRVLEEKMRIIGYEVVTSRGDAPGFFDNADV